MFELMLIFFALAIAAGAAFGYLIVDERDRARRRLLREEQMRERPIACHGAPRTDTAADGATTQPSRRRWRRRSRLARAEQETLARILARQYPGLRLEDLRRDVALGLHDEHPLARRRASA